MGKSSSGLFHETKGEVRNEIRNANGNDVNDIIAITKIVWLERGNLEGGLEHILKHANEFAAKGSIPDFLTAA